MESVRHVQLGDSATRPGLVLRTVNQDILNESPIYKVDSPFAELTIFDQDVLESKKGMTPSERARLARK
jgi:hypothetical protein